MAISWGNSGRKELILIVCYVGIQQYQCFASLLCIFCVSSPLSGGNLAGRRGLVGGPAAGVVEEGMMHFACMYRGGSGKSGGVSVDGVGNILPIPSGMNIAFRIGGTGKQGG